MIMSATAKNLGAKSARLSITTRESYPTEQTLCSAAQLSSGTAYHQEETTPGTLGLNLDTNVYDLTNPWPDPNSKSINLESIDYEGWIGQNRDWFKQEFPQVFRLKNALAKEGIEVD